MSGTPPERPEQQPAWHTLSGPQALKEVGSGPQGLSEEEVRARRERHGPNVLRPVRPESALKLLWRQLQNPLIWVLLASGGVGLLLGKVVDGFVILLVVVINTLIGFVQELRASRAIAALAQMMPEQVTVVRAGRQASVPASELVPGDLVQLSSGDRVPADLRVVEVRNLRVEEAALTGESVPVEKALQPVEETAPLADRTCMLHGGTLVTTGTASAVVVATGRHTELGRISQMLEETTELQTPLTARLATVSKWLTVAIIALAALMLGVGLWRGYGVADAALVAITLAVGAIPEGLPAVVTITLAVGVQRMAARRAIIRKLPAVETLGSTSIICTDKTGTLTRNEMTVRGLWTPRGRTEVTGVGYAPEGELRQQGRALEQVPEEVLRLLRAGALCNDSGLERCEDGRWELVGDPTEGALLVAARKAGLSLSEERERWPRLDAIPFESEHRFMATLHRTPEGEAVVFLKGAPEVVFERSRLPEGFTREKVLEEVDWLAREGMRVLAVATRKLPPDTRTLSQAQVAEGLELLGLQGMIDPPREEAIRSVRICHRAGVRVKMMTGDHRATAEAIGAQLSLRSEAGALSGEELSRMDDATLERAANEVNVFARVAPEHKLRLVRALQKSGNVVAMTGDGVNDAPALKQANIGVAMGITGTAAAKEASDVVLIDDNFASIEAAVEEGRRVYDNLIKSIAFLLPTNLGLALILLVAVLAFPLDEVGGQWVALLPMQPTQLLWINMVSGVSLALPLSMEASEPSNMLHPPRSPDAPVLGRFVVVRTVVAAVLMAGGAIAIFLWEYAQVPPDGAAHVLGVREAQTMAVTTVSAFQVFYVLHCRSLRDSLLKLGLWSNPHVYAGIALLVVLQAGFIYLPFLQAIFETAPLDGRQLGLCVLVGAIILPAISLEKALARRVGRRSAEQEPRPRPPSPTPSTRRPAQAGR